MRAYTQNCRISFFAALATVAAYPLFADNETNYWVGGSAGEFLQDPPYRESVASQHSAYNQPTWPGFYFGPDLLGHRLWFRGQYLP